MAQLVLVEVPITCNETGPICNNATATAESNGMVVQDWDYFCLNTEEPPNPCIQLFKSISDTSIAGPYHEGDVVTFNVTIVNCGDVDLEVDFMDALLGNATSFTLAAGAVSTWLPEFVIPAGDYAGGELCDITNTAALNASYDTWVANLTDSVCVDVEEPIIEPVPCLQLFKSVDQTVALVGDTVYFNVTLVNCGNVDLVVDLVDEFFANDTEVNIAAGQTLEWILPYVVQESDWVADSACDIHNIVSVNSTYETWTFEASADACVDVVVPCIQIDKWVVPDFAAVGENVTYYYNVSNCGDVELTGVVVYDDVTMETLDIGDNTLAPGEWVVVESNFTIPEASPDPLCNNATATGNYGDVIVEDWDVACVSISSPTRTLGFWKTHTNDTLAAFALLGSNFTIGCDSCTKIIDSPEALFAALYAGNSFESDGVTPREDYEQARILLVKQLIPAILNVAMFGSFGTETELIGLANGTYCSLNSTTVMTYHDQLDDFNNGGNMVVVPGFPSGSATPEASEAYADSGMWYWDDTCSPDPRP